MVAFIKGHEADSGEAVFHERNESAVVGGKECGTHVFATIKHHGQPVDKLLIADRACFRNFIRRAIMQRKIELAVWQALRETIYSIKNNRLYDDVFGEQSLGLGKFQMRWYAERTGTVFLSDAQECEATWHTLDLTAIA